MARNEFDYLVELASEAEVRSLNPDFAKLACDRLSWRDRHGEIGRAALRFHFPLLRAQGLGSTKTPVTGSAHCCLSEWWGEKLGKSAMVGFQASERGGVVKVTPRSRPRKTRGEGRD